MDEHDFNLRDWRDIQLLRAQGVLAELLGVDLEQADHGIRTYAALTGMSVATVAGQVCDRELTISYETCVGDHAARRPSGTRRDHEH